jgi:hypothetical protein
MNLLEIALQCQYGIPLFVFYLKGQFTTFLNRLFSTAGDTCGNNRRHLRSAFKQPQVISGRHGVISGHHGSFPALWGHFRLLLSHFWLLETISATMKTYQPLQCHDLSLGSHFQRLFVISGHSWVISGRYGRHFRPQWGHLWPLGVI